MYARRFENGPRFRPTSLGIALAINGGVVAALLLAGPELIPRREPKPLTFQSIPLDEPKPIPSPEPSDAPTARAPERVDTPVPPLPLPSDNQLRIDPQPLPSPTESLPGPAATGVPTPEATALTPVLVAAVLNQSGAQPDYPDTARDAGLEGVVKLRVLIGTDGRVKQVQRIAGPDVFWRAAQRHALARWRFTPATRGGVPEKSWRVMDVRFTLD